MIRTILLDDTPLVLEAVADRFRREPGFELVGTASDCDSALPRIAEVEPDLVVMETSLPGRGAFELAAEILRTHRATRVVILTDCLCDVFIDAALRAGASGYLLKDESFETLFDNLRRIARGERKYSPKVLRRLNRNARQTWLQSQSAACLSALTHQQLEAVRHLARGDSVKEVAGKLDLSPRSIEGLKYRIMQQLGVHDRVALARFAIREGLTLP
ncbi:MAG: response regulator transcription factor [Planctomycetaceae bacterium]